jgi:hypothetical protein
VRLHRRDWNLARRVINQTKITWALGTFKPFKSTRTDEIVPVLWQQGAEHILPHLCRIFRACSPTAGRQVKATFIPKPWKLHYTEAKAYRHIILSSFLLKTMDKLVDKYIKDGVLKEYPLHRNKHAYQTVNLLKPHCTMW